MGGIRETSQPYDAIARTVSGPTFDDWWTRADTGKFPWTVLPPYGHGGGGVAGENPTISVIEFYVTPFDRWASDNIEESVPSDLTAGEVIGFGIAVLDADPPEYDGIALPWVSEATQHFEHYLGIWELRADGFIDGLLLPAAPAVPEDSAIEAVSWGRIKASLEFE